MHPSSQAGAHVTAACREIEHDHHDVVEKAPVLMLLFKLEQG